MGCSLTPEKNFLETLFLRQIKKCTFLRYDLDTYHRKGEEKGFDGLPTAEDTNFQGYNFLYQAVDAHLFRTLGASHRQEELNAISGNKNASLTPLGNGKGKGKGKGNGKGKGIGKGKKGNEKGDTSNIPCQFHAKGSCKKGDACNYKHGDKASGGNSNKPKGDQSSKPCYFFAKGSCKYGDKCQKSHAPIAAVPKAKSKAKAKAKAKAEA